MGGSRNEPLSVRVVRSLADAQGVEASNLEFRLGETIDTDALDAMAAHDGREWELRFEVDGHEVEVVPGEPVRVDGDAYR